MAGFDTGELFTNLFLSAVVEITTGIESDKLTSQFVEKNIYIIIFFLLLHERAPDAWLHNFLTKLNPFSPHMLTVTAVFTFT